MRFHLSPNTLSGLERAHHGLTPWLTNGCPYLGGELKIQGWVASFVSCIAPESVVYSTKDG